MTRIATLTAIVLSVGLVTATPAQPMSDDESAVWALEEAYWEFVKANDLAFNLQARILVQPNADARLFL